MDAATGALLDQLEFGDPTAATVAMTRLQEAAPVSPAAISRLIRIAEKGGRTSRAMAVSVLAASGPAAGSAVPVLTQMLGPEEDVWLRALALSTLGDVGPAGGASLPQIEACLDDGDPGVRESASYAISALSRSTAVPLPVVERCLASSDPAVRRNGLTAVPEGRGNTEALGPLASQVARLLADPDADIRANACAALDDLGLAALPHVDDIRALANDADPTVRANAAAAIANLRDLEALQTRLRPCGAPPAE
jgi:HEAT repeat protein